MRYLFTLFLLSTLTSCGMAIKRNPRTDDEVMTAAKQYIEKDFYEEARTQLMRIRTEFPDSPHQVNADFLIAQSYYKEGAYSSAASSYEEFLRTYPGRPEQVQALYELGLSYSKQMPDNPQRDTRSTEKVVETFKRLLVEHPQSEYAEKAQQRIDEANDKLAKKIFDIANFYQKQKEYDAAQRRYAELIRKYPDHSLAKTSMKRRIESLEQLKRTDEANELQKEFKSKY